MVFSRRILAYSTAPREGPHYERDSSWGLFEADGQPLEPPAVHGDDLQRQALPRPRIADLGDAAQQPKHQAAGRADFRRQARGSAPCRSAPRDRAGHAGVHQPAGRRRAGRSAAVASRRCSSWISPTNSSSTSSMVTRPSVPPNSSSTMRHLRPLLAEALQQLVDPQGLGHQQAPGGTSFRSSIGQPMCCRNSRSLV